MESFILAEQYTISGVVKIIDSIQLATSSASDFNYTDKYFTMPYAKAVSIGTAINDYAAGILKFSEASQAFIDSFNGTMLYQNSGNCKFNLLLLRGQQKKNPPI